MYNRHMSEIDLVDVRKQHRTIRLFAVLGALTGLLIIMAFLLWTPITGPWAQERQGMANLRQAAQERQILVAQAEGELQAAQAQADAIRTMGEAARNFPEYRTQLFIQAFSEALENGTIGQLIYVPVETGLPLTEAGRR